MKLDTALNILLTNGLCNSGVTWGDYLTAVMLSREALIRHKQAPDLTSDQMLLPLPGETED